jgi:hydroxypyruvate reductase
VEETAIFLVSGGGSALAAVPASGLSLADKVASTRVLLRAGTSIDETNAIRKHLSALKGGQLAAASRARRRLALVLCDVPSGELASVASGPTSGDPTTFGHCLQIVASRGVALPPPAMARLQGGAQGLVPETPKPGDLRVAGVEHKLLAGPMDLALTARMVAEEPCAIEERPFTGSVEDLAKRIALRVRQPGGPALLAFAGEPTVRVPADAGPGGRMQHLALLLLRELGATRFEALCAGSDGRDGDTPHAGAAIDQAGLSRARATGLDLDRALARFDSASACAALGCALPAFDSGTNLCDLVLVRRG